MSYRLFIEVSAEKDIEEAFAWITGESRSSAIKWYRELLEAIETLKMFPERCPLAPEK